MIEKHLWFTGALIFFVLGSIHLHYTFFTKKFHPRNPALATGMKSNFPWLTKDTTMWKAWIGFNASHSAGAIFIGLFNMILAVQYFSIIQSSIFLPLLNILTVAFYLWLAKKYWFKIPFAGMLVATCCFMVASILIFFR